VTRYRHAVSLDEATRRIRTDHDLLLARVDGLSEDDLVAKYRTAAGPLGDFCESLHDLAAHVVMWDEINLAVLSEAAAGRTHWSLQPLWETADAGRRLNRGGVAAGRHVPPHLLLHRVLTVRDALLDQFGRFDEAAWTQAGPAPVLVDGFGGLAQRAWTVPGQPAFWHAAIHLGQLPGHPGTP
jgi:hypothetical protein